ncbi:uncharacterized protein LOC124678286 [Lolium rigidum]|uniref:uncharacterized protein LOC124678286 n=1 Tax=Lolium rigidum TaxID=89674 RepID=UPI001F5E120A|nr:uncharacterized protein LOC124678286 [Lolium rigidum]
MAMAALRHGARRLACQRPPAIFRAAVADEQRRLIHVGPPAVGRTFSLAEEQRRLSPRLIHGGRSTVGRTYARPLRSNHRGKPKPSTYQERLTAYVKLAELVKDALMEVLKLSCFALAGLLLWNDLKGPRHVPRITRILLESGPPEELRAGGGKKSDAGSKSS